MLQSGLAFFLSMLLTFIFGGIIGVLLRLLLALLFLPLIATFAKNKNANTVISGGPWILTIEFITNIFYGWFACYIGVWLFRAMNVSIDLFYPLMVICSFLWFDLSRIQKEQKRIKSLETSGPNEQLAYELTNQDVNKHRVANFLSNHLNSRYTALFGKIAGAIIGGYNLIYSIN
jgi:hypothetical protein